jgi:two-component system chemotaxis response regulator CheB
MPNQISIMLVDDSAVIRGILTQILEAEGDMKITASVANGALAIEKLKVNPVEIIILDIEMPVMDGLTALPQLVALRPETKVLMCSTLSVENGEATMKALALGATDYVAKPSSFSNIANGVDFKDELRNKIRMIVTGSRRPAFTPHPVPASGAQPVANSTTTRTATQQAASLAERLAANAPPVIRPLPSLFRPSILSIGCSTGGPKALPSVMPHLLGIKVPVIITQHMPATFTRILAEQLEKSTGFAIKEAAEGDVLEPGKAYVAPGGFHMAFKRENGQVLVKTDNGPPVNFCKPAVDVMLNSAIEVIGGNILSLILTGMGSDGYLSCQNLVKAGGAVIAQDRETSIVWGMPGAVATDELCSAVLPLDAIGPHIKRTFPSMFTLGNRL